MKPSGLVAVALATLVPCGVLAANSPLLIDELAGARSLAMGGAHRGVGTSNDTLYLNPAGMAITKRYAIEMQYGYSPWDKSSHLNFSALDSKSGPVAAAAGYSYDRDDRIAGNAGMSRLYLGGAYAISDGLAFGLTNRYLRGSFIGRDGAAHKVNAYAGDIGLLASVAGAMVGVTYNNVIGSDFDELTPPTVGLGVGLGNGMLTLAGDVEILLREPHARKFVYRGGAEYVVGEGYPLRAGYTRETVIHDDGTYGPQDFVSLGAGWVSRSGGLDLAYRQALRDRHEWRFVLGLKFFI